MVNKKLWAYIPRSRLWCEHWLDRAVENTDLGLTKRGEPRAKTRSAWIWLLIESVIAERYYNVRRELAGDYIEIDTFLAGE